MSTAEDYESIANVVYGVDPSWNTPMVKAGNTFYTDKNPTKQQWQVVEVAANAENGFQAMAVAPVTADGVDLSHIQIAYAGTNFDDPHDVATDLGLVLASQTAQAGEAMTFAEKMKKRFPDSSFSTVGHSLGGFLALYVAAENRWSSTAFNAPDAYRVMTPKTKAWLDKRNAAGTNPLTNYVNRFDPVGNFFVDKTGAAVFVDDVPGRPPLDYHNIGKDNKGNPYSLRFDANGEIIGAGVTQVDYGVIALNLDQRWAADLAWGAQKDSPYPKVLVAMEPAFALAEKIGGLAERLQAIKDHNNGLSEKMQAALDEAKREYPANHPYVSHVDVENCVATHALEVHQHIDRDAVTSVNTLLDTHIRTVNALHDGIHNAIINTLAQDVHAAAAFTSQSGK